MSTIYEKSIVFINDWKESNEKINNNKISVVIPAYHPRYLKKVLDHLSKLNSVYEAIIVFDSYDDDPNLVIDNYSFKLIVLQHDHNRNAPSARNTGAAFATGDIILFLDQDMILSPKFIPNALKLLEANNNKAIILGLRETVEVERVSTLENWKESNYYKDWRVSTCVNDNFLDLTVSNSGSSSNNCINGEVLNLLKQTNQFRKLGIKKELTVGFWDLASMVVSHTLAIPKNELFNIGGFPEWIVGWGGEDIALGFLAISKHLFIIPTEVGSYHIKHAPHSGSEERKWNEMKKNLKKYKIWATTINSYPTLSPKELKQRAKVIYESAI